ncbi:hypothetical protein XV92_04660 [Vibrio metoecus]|uniref:Uncharacterized protein n=1 Tax=Vibrio metoecus TaxID=1481663 RepID=A0A0Q0TM27_VIBMT|nr:hypothetical protein [Vibrio metoecus]KQB03367.1 hypothetical protein XV92_04660 [Vibrio metoecus]
MLRTLTLTNLALLLFFTLFLLFLPSKASAEINCQIGISTGYVDWSGETFGDKPYTCAATCRYNLDKVATCFVNNGTCHGEFISIGQHCLMDNGQIDPSNGLRFGGNTVIRDPSADPTKPWDPNEPSTMPSKVQNVLNSMPRNTGNGVDQATAYKNMAHLDGMGVMTLDELLIQATKSVDANNRVADLVRTMTGTVDALRSLSVHTELNTYKTAESSNSISQNILAILNKLNESGSGSGDGGKSEEYLKYIADTIKSDFLANSAISTSHLNFLGSITTFIQQDLNKLVKRPPLSLSNVESGINNLNNSIDSLSEGIDSINSNVTGVNSGIQNLNDLISGKGLNKAPINSDINFGDMPLYDSQSLEKLNTDITDLQKEYSEKIKDFKKLFSFDLSKLNGGEYKDHSLTFTFANGNRTSITSSVFPALVSNAGIIASVILFLAALAGLRIVMGGGDK